MNYVGFNKDTLMEIEVKVGELGGGLDWGFASVEHCSNIKQ